MTKLYNKFQAEAVIKMQNGPIRLSKPLEREAKKYMRLRDKYPFAEKDIAKE